MLNILDCRKLQIRVLPMGLWIQIWLCISITVAAVLFCCFTLKTKVLLLKASPRTYIHSCFVVPRDMARILVTSACSGGIKESL